MHGEEAATKRNKKKNNSHPGLYVPDDGIVSTPKPTGSGPHVKSKSNAGIFEKTLASHWEWLSRMIRMSVYICDIFQRINYRCVLPPYQNIGRCWLFLTTLIIRLFQKKYCKRIKSLVVLKIPIVVKHIKNIINDIYKIFWIRNYQKYKNKVNDDKYFDTEGVFINS